jgi:hypothetical protein
MPSTRKLFYYLKDLKDYLKDLMDNKTPAKNFLIFICFLFSIQVYPHHLQYPYMAGSTVVSIC